MEWLKIKLIFSFLNSLGTHVGNHSPMVLKHTGLRKGWESYTWITLPIFPINTLYIPIMFPNPFCSSQWWQE